MIQPRIRGLFAALALVASAGWAQAPTIQISGANFRPLPLAAPAPKLATGVPSGAATEFDSAFTFDLAAAGIFQVLDRKSFTADPKEGFTAATIDFSRWQDVGADALVKTQLSVEGESLQGQLWLFTVATGKQELTIDHAVPLREPRRLAHFFADALYRQMTHEPGPFESHLGFSKRSSSGKDVYLADWDGRSAVALSSGGLNLLPTVTPDNKGLAFTSYRRGKPEIYVARVGDGTRALVSNGQMATGVAYSPDGKRIAYSLAEGESAQVWTARADGSGAHAVTDTPYFINSSPSWSPDGKRLAFVSNRGGSPQIYVMDADGRNVRRLTFQGNYNQTPSWSPRGDLIAFTARDERNAFDLFVVNVDTGQITRLTQDQGNNQQPSFAPNGRLLVFTSDRRGGSQLFVTTADGRSQLPLPAGPGDYFTPDWGP